MSSYNHVVSEMSLVLEDLVFMPSQGADTNLDYNYDIEPFNILSRMGG